MKKITFNFSKWALSIIFLFTVYSIDAQKSMRDHPLGNNISFLNQLQSELKTAEKNNGKAKLNLSVSTQETLHGIINYQQNKDGILHIEGEIQDQPHGSFNIKINDSKLEGNIIFPQSKKAYVYYSQNGNAYIKEEDINKVICVDFHIPKSFFQGKNTAHKNATVTNITSLQSFPGAAGCLLLDFDGYVVPAGSGWNAGNTFTALPSGMTDANIQEAWEIVAEDYRPFNINVTTDENVFNTYPQNKRRRCVITPTDLPSPGGTGTSLINSFSSSSDLPCWVFTLSAGVYGKIVGEVASHELGHTFGLYHDGQGPYTYYGGNGNWAPIMGISYYKNVTQWSKGEYSNGTNHQDDLAIISNTSTNGVGYRQDNIGDTFSTANILVTAGEVVNAAQNQSVIDHTDDIDMFMFHANGGNINLKVQAAERHSDLLLKVLLYNSQHLLVASYMGNTTNLSDPITININLAAGDYYLAISGTGEGTPDTGYTSYSSLGIYSISGNIPKIGVLATGEKILDEKESTIVYPSLVINEFTVDTKNTGKYEMKIFSSAGQLLQSNLLSDQITQISFSDKPPGKYFIVLKNLKSGLNVSHSIIKQ
ncbi:hypothetical protein SAMN05880574_12441 [Chryseobacterium sp. RU37D]|uniref:zinc-dependent metalloprotease n=1 Tax=Chryseobacterium sp. RU37D TaxID=1907397 RepID=UPI000956AB7B|nr:zinc-dependent metalloprotease [Chryseobacterium sp. RU37D]SIQ77091.1 hypothetical protein SAMN05880574_12441 [Chryseobacterium sp. RU37D]